MIIGELMKQEPHYIYYMDSYQKLKNKQLYQLCPSPQNIDGLLQVYKIDYLKEKDLVLYNQRIKNPHPHHPKVVSIDSKPVAKGTDAVYHTVTLQHTPFRLQQIERSFNQIIQRPLNTLITQSIIGFQDLYRKFGAFRIKTSMIGFDKKWVTKVWVNSNFAKNHFNPFDHLASDSQETMIKGICLIFEKYGYQNEELKNAETFSQALKILSEKPINSQHLLIHHKQKNGVKSRVKQAYQYEMPLTPKGKSREQLSFVNLKGKLPKNQDVLQITDKSNMHQIRIKTPKISEQTNIPEKIQKKVFRNYRQDIRNSQPPPPPFVDLDSEDFLVIRREIQTPQYTDQKAAKQYLASTINPYQNKIKFINFLLQSAETNQKVKQLASIFEHALIKDPDLYKNLLKHKGDITSLTIQEKQKINDLIKRKYFSNNQVNNKPEQRRRKYTQQFTHAPQYLGHLTQSSRNNIHFIQNECNLQSNRALPKQWTAKEQFPNSFCLQSDQSDIRNCLNLPHVNNHPQFVPDVPKNDGKLVSACMNKYQVCQPRSHQKNAYESLRGKLHSNQLVTVNSLKQTNNFRQPMLKYIVKQ